MKLKKMVPLKLIGLFVVFVGQDSDGAFCE